MRVQITRLPHAQDLPLPQYATAGAVGFDFLAAVEIEIQPGEIALVPTGLVIKVPDGFVLAIVPRSSTPRKKGLDMPHSLGIIDQDYCGPEDEILLQVRNFSDQSVMVKRGEKFAQGLFLKVEKAQWEEVSAAEIENQTRGGFGSTGK